MTLPDEWIRDDILFWFKGEEGRNGGLLSKIGTMNFPWANRRFFLPHNTPPKWCHPELILPDNYSKSQHKARMSEGSPTLVSSFIDHHW
jgi:hypothetical protein